MERAREDHQNARLLFLATALFWCAQYSYTQFINPELEKMGMNAAFMGLVSGAYGFSQMALRIPLGILSDRLGRHKPFVVAGCLATALAALVFLLLYSPAGFLLGRSLAGVASASWVSFTVLYSGYFSHAEGPRRISQLNAANMAGRLFGFLLILMLVPLLSIRFSFVFSALAGGLAFLLALPLREKMPKQQGLRLKDILAVAADPYLRACSVMGILTQVVAFSTYYGFTVNAAKALGAGSAGLTLLNITLLIPTLVMNMLVTGKLLKRYSGQALVSLGFLLSTLYCVLVPLAPSLLSLNLLQILGGMASTLTFGVLIGQSVRDIPQRLRGVAMGFYQAVYGIGMTLGPILMGLVIDSGGLRAAFLMMAGVALLSALLGWKLLGIQPPQLEESPKNAYDASKDT